MERAPERARTELHAALEPADRLLVRKGARGLLNQLLVAQDLEARPHGLEPSGDIVGGEGRPEIRTTHGVLAAIRTRRTCCEVIGRERCPDRAARVARRRLDPDVVELAVAQHLAVRHAIERDAAREAEVLLPGLYRKRARQAQHDLLGDGLDRRREIHLALGQQVLGLARRPAEQRVELRRSSSSGRCNSRSSPCSCGTSRRPECRSGCP